MRYRALIEYDGSNYYGYQRQIESQPTVQSALEKAIGHLAQQPISVTGAGRTDSGVHATGQVISFDMNWRHGVESLHRALNANLPSDVVVMDLSESSPSFHPRFDARRRAYEYYIYNAPVRSPIQRFRSWHIAQPLNVNLMNRAAQHLVGIHDFATFGQPPQGENTEREVFSANWHRRDLMVIFYIEANAFLYRMVRSLVGSLKAVGNGSWTVEDFVDAFRARDRSRAGTVCPAHGLFLTSVVYEE